MINWIGFICCLTSGAALYLLSRITGRDVEFLKSATRVYQLKDLEKTVLPSNVAVLGRVGSDKPIKCEHSDLLGVIIEETIQEHFLKRNWKFSWIQDCTLMRPLIKEVPWYLEDGTYRVNVVGAQDGIGFFFTMGSEVFQKSEPCSFVRGILNYIRGLEMLGVKRSERLLPIGTQLTIVGQAIKDCTGDVTIQKPVEGSFYVSDIPLDQLISSFGKWSRRLKYASMGLTLLGLVLITKPMVECILKRTKYILEKRQKQRMLRKRAAERKQRATEGLEERHGNNSSDICVICLDRKYEGLFLSVLSYVLLHDMFEARGKLPSLPEINRSGFEDLPTLKKAHRSHLLYSAAPLYIYPF